LRRSRRWIPLSGQALFWFSGLPVMLGVAIAPAWRLLGYRANILLLVLLGRPVTAFVFGLFTGLLGLVSDVACAASVFCGTGLSDEARAAILAELQASRRKLCPFPTVPILRDNFGDPPYTRPNGSGPPSSSKWSTGNA
jgi:hypothetical protein